MSGVLQAIWVTGTGGAPMRPLPSAAAVAGRGLEGDRYARGAGYWSTDPRLCDDVTLVAAEDLEAAQAEHGVVLTGGASRRNLVTTGVDLAALVGRRFTIGTVLLVGNRPCEPCRYLDGLTGGPAKAALTGRGGLRASVVAGGRLAVGDAVVVAPPTG